MGSTVECVITRYNEHIDWIDYINNNVTNFVVYNKGTNDALFKNLKIENVSNKLTINKLPNIGRIDHTIAYHILTNWDNLADITVFLPASIMMCQRKGSYLNAIRKKIPTVSSKMNGFFSPKFHKINDSYNYSIDNYQAEGKCNRNNNPFIKSEFKDFKTWKEALIDNRPIKYLAMRGMFIVCKENIKMVDQTVYQNLLTSLSVGDNIENGHFAERIWAHLFTQPK